MVYLPLHCIYLELLALLFNWWHSTTSYSLFCIIPYSVQNHKDVHHTSISALNLNWCTIPCQLPLLFAIMVHLVQLHSVAQVRICVHLPPCKCTLKQIRVHACIRMYVHVREYVYTYARMCICMHNTCFAGICIIKVTSNWARLHSMFSILEESNWLVDLFQNQYQYWYISILTELLHLQNHYCSYKTISIYSSSYYICKPLVRITACSGRLAPFRSICRLKY